MKTVRIYGMGPNITFAPPVPPGVEVWCCNDPIRAYRARRPQARDEWTRWFNLHGLDHILALYPRGWKWFQQQQGEKVIYLQDAHESITGSQTFPKDALIAFFGHRYFTFSVAWQMALAIYEGFERIELYGFRLHRTHRRYGPQRVCFFYWVEEARRRGIEVVIPEEVGWDTPGDPWSYTGPLYGYETLCEFPRCRACRRKRSESMACRVG